jgi:molybdopterin-binding protein
VPVAPGPYQAPRRGFIPLLVAPPDTSPQPVETLCSFVHIAKPGRTMKLSARNQIRGKVVAVQKGQTTAHVRIDIGNGVVVTSSITNEAVDELGLAVGDEAIAVIKASDVMVAK